MAVASPGGREIGRVSVRVVPDTSKFGTLTEAKLREVEKALKVSIPTALDNTGLHKDLAKLKTELRAFARSNKVVFQASIETGAVTTAVKSATRKAVTAARSTPIKVPVVADQDDFNTSMRALGRKVAKQTAAKLAVTPDDEILRQQLAKLVKALIRETKIAVPVEPVKATEQRTKVASLVKAIQDIANTLPPPDVPVHLRADTDPLIAQLRREGKKIADLTKVRLPVEATEDADSLKRLVDHLEATTSVKLPVTVAERANLRGDVQRIVRDIEKIADRHAPVIRPKLDFLDKIFDVAKFRAFATQLTLISARGLAYATLLGPPLLLAASGAEAMVSALTLGLPALAAVAATIGVIALGFDALFGPKITGDGAAHRLGGIFTPLVEDVQKLKVEIGSLLTQGMDPLVDRLKSTAFPVFAAGMKTVAGATRGALAEVLNLASSARVVSGGSLLLAASARNITTLTGSLRYLSSGLLTLAVASIPAMQRVSEGLVGLAARFAGFIDRAARSGALRDTIDRAVTDTGAFIGGLAKITGELLSLLASLRPVAERTFGALAAGLSGIITGLDRVLRGFQAGGHSLVLPLADDLGVVLAALQSVGKHILDTLALLAGNETFQQFIVALADVTTALAEATAKVLINATDTVSAIASVVGTPILQFLTNVANSLTPLIQLLSDNAIAAGALATVLTVRLALGLKTLLLARFAGALQLLGAAFRVVRTEATAAAIAQATFAGTAGAASVVTGLTAAIRALGTSLMSLLAALGVVNIALIGGVAAIGVLQAGLNNLNRATDEARERFRGLVDGVSGLDSTESAGAIRRLNKAISDGAKLDASYGGMLGNLRRGWDAISRGPLSRAYGELGAAQEAITQVNEKTANTTINLTSIARKTGIAYSTLAKIARDSNIDLSKPFSDPESERARQALLSDLDQVAAQTGLTQQQVIDAVGDSREAWQQYGQAVADAVKATKTAFESQTNLFSNVDLNARKTATDKLTQAQDKLAKAQRDQKQLAERLGVTNIKTAKQAVTSNQQWADAAQNVTDAQKDVAEAQKDVKAATIDAQIKDLVKTAQDFNKNIDTLLRKGLDPTLIQQMLLAGPKVAGPIAEQMVTDSSGRMIKLYNEAAKTLDKVNVAVIEKQRLITIAINDLSSPQRTKDLGKAFNITEILRNSPSATAEDIAKKLGLTPAEVTRVGHEFGYEISRAAKETVTSVPVPLAPDTTLIDHYLLTPGYKPVILDYQGTPPPGISLGNLQHHATGGLIKGPGTWTSDSILARLSNNEFVQPSRSVAHYGVGVMEALRHRRVPRELLHAIATGNYALAAKLAQANAVASRAPAPVHAIRPAAAEVHVPPPDSSGPRTLTVVDHDGIFRGQMRVAAIKSHRDREQAERLRRLGKWGS